MNRSELLEAVRSIIRRMSWGSGLAKAWSVSMTGALVTVATIPEHARWAWFGVLVQLTFWALDAHLVRQRRLFEKMYDVAEMAPESQLDFSMDTKAVDSEADAWVSVLFSTAVAPYHGAIVAGVVVWLLLR